MDEHGAYSERRLDDMGMESSKLQGKRMRILLIFHCRYRIQGLEEQSVIDVVRQGGQEGQERQVEMVRSSSYTDR